MVWKEAVVTQFEAPGWSDGKKS